MDETRDRLVKCFHTVFPDLETPETAAQEGVTEWDSVAAIMLVNVIEEEFNIQMDYEELASLDSFSRVLDYLNRLPKAS
jgi:acyl carrier protein